MLAVLLAAGRSLKADEVIPSTTHYGPPAVTINYTGTASH